MTSELSTTTNNARLNTSQKAKAVPLLRGSRRSGRVLHLGMCSWNERAPPLGPLGIIVQGLFRDARRWEGQRNHFVREDRRRRKRDVAGSPTRRRWLRGLSLSAVQERKLRATRKGEASLSRSEFCSTRPQTKKWGS